MGDIAAATEPDPGRRCGSEVRRLPYRSTPERPLRFTPTTRGGICHDRRTAAATPSDQRGSRSFGIRGTWHTAQPRTPRSLAGLVSW